MKSGLITIGIAGMFLMAACSTSYYAQKNSSDDLYSANSSGEGPVVSHSSGQPANTSANQQVIDPNVIDDRSEDQNSSGTNYSQQNYDGNQNSGYNNQYNGYDNSNGSSQWSDASMNRMGCASASFGYYGPASTGFTFYSPLYYSPGFSMSLGFSFSSGYFYNPGWNYYAWMPPPPIYYPYYPYYPYNPYNPYGSYAFMDPYGYGGGYYGGYYPPYYNNQYYGPHGTTSNNTSGNNGRVYVPEHRSGNTGSGGVTGQTDQGGNTTRTVHPLNNPQSQGARRFNAPPPVAPSAPRSAPNSNNSNNSGRPKNEFRPLPQASAEPQPIQPVVIYRNDINQQSRMQSTEGFHQTLNQENDTRSFGQHSVQNPSRSSSTNSSANNYPHSNGNRR